MHLNNCPVDLDEAILIGQQIRELEERDRLQHQLDEMVAYEAEELAQQYDGWTEFTIGPLASTLQAMQVSAISITGTVDLQPWFAPTTTRVDG